MGALVGETVGNYRITDLIGQGGMGVVYRAEHVLLGKRAAVKVLLPERSSSREIIDRFFNEAKATTLIDDPGIVDIFDFGRLPDGNAYIVMELLEGETLGERLKRLGTMAPDQAATIARHIARTLAAAHAHGIIHRDLKPDNVFLVRDAALPRGERAKLLDFGIAKLAGSRQPSELVKTETGRLMGTPYYMSPEQCRGAGRIDHRTDIYSLGCVLYQMLTGRPPFALEGAGEILAAHIHVSPRPPRMHEPSVPAALEAVVLRMLQKDPGRRFQSAEEVFAALNRAALRYTVREAAGSEPNLGNADKQVVRRMQGSPKDPAFTEATTLSTTANDVSSWSPPEVQKTGQLPRRRRLWPWLAAGSALAAFWGAILTMLVVGGDTHDSAATGNRKGEAGAGAPAPQPPIPPVRVPTSSPSAPAEDPIVRESGAGGEEPTVKLMVQSRPDGASVYRESDGIRLGRTPLEVLARRGRGEAVFIVRRNGFRTERLALPVDQDQESLVVLRPRGPSGLRPTHTAPPDERGHPAQPVPTSSETTDGALSDPFGEEKQPEPVGAGEATGEGPDRQTGEDATADGQNSEDEAADGQGSQGETPDGETPADEAPEEQRAKKRGKDDALDPFKRRGGR